MVTRTTLSVKQDVKPQDSPCSQCQRCRVGDKSLRRLRWREKAGVFRASPKRKLVKTKYCLLKEPHQARDTNSREKRNERHLDILQQLGSVHGVIEIWRVHQGLRLISLGRVRQRAHLSGFTTRTKFFKLAAIAITTANSDCRLQ